VKRDIINKLNKLISTDARKEHVETKTCNDQMRNLLSYFLQFLFHLQNVFALLLQILVELLDLLFLCLNVFLLHVEPVFLVLLDTVLIGRETFQSIRSKVNCLACSTWTVEISAQCAWVYPMRSIITSKLGRIV